MGRLCLEVVFPSGRYKGLHYNVLDGEEERRRRTREEQTEVKREKSEGKERIKGGNAIEAKCFLLS